MNPFGLNGHWRIDPDNRQDRGNGVVTKRKMTLEEMKKYGCTVNSENKKSEIATIPEMVRKDIAMKNKINKERLIEICKEHGFTGEAYKMAAKEFGVAAQSIGCYVSNNKLKQIISFEPTTVMEGKIIENVGLTSNLVSDELEIITKIKSILQENQSLSGENKTLKENISKVKSALEDILKSIA